MPAAVLEIRDAGPLELDDEMIEFEDDFDDPRDPQACFVPQPTEIATYHQSQVCGKKA